MNSTQDSRQDYVHRIKYLILVSAKSCDTSIVSDLVSRHKIGLLYQQDQSLDTCVSKSCVFYREQQNISLRFWLFCYKI
jgi:hypothetical protein